MKKSLFLIFATIIIASIHAQDAIKNVIVETYYVSDANDATDTIGGKLDTGSKTYRIYVQMQPEYKLLSLFGNKNHPIKIKSTAPFFNNADRDQTLGYLQNTSYLKENTVALDSWLTLGLMAKDKKNNKNYFGVLKSQDTNGSIIGGVNNDGGSAEIAGGLLKNTDALAGISLTTADGMDTLMNVPTGWVFNGLDSTIFNSAKIDSFVSYNVNLQCSGVMGVNHENNQVLIAQLTTKGKISFELNLGIDSAGTILNYVATGKEPNYRYSKFLTYPIVSKCGCSDPNYFEYNNYLKNDYNCSNTDSCKTKIAFGCMDPKACNYDPNANYNMLCCYPGSCNVRDIALVCPNLGEKQAEVRAYPNPVSDKLELSITNFDTDKVLVSVFDVYGKKYFENYVNTTISDVNEIDFATYSKGLYLLRVQNKKGVIITKYLIKN